MRPEPMDQTDRMLSAGFVALGAFGIMYFELSNALLITYLVAIFVYHVEGISHPNKEVDKDESEDLDDEEDDEEEEFDDDEMPAEEDDFIEEENTQNR